MSYPDLRGRIRTVYGTERDFAQSMGLSKSAMSLKLNGHSEWTASEIRKACELLGIPAAELHHYFFA